MVILCPNRNVPCQLTDPLLYELNYEKKPYYGTGTEEDSKSKWERQPNMRKVTLMHQDTGMSNRQYGKATQSIYKTMYESIKILWDQELKYRPDFSVSMVS